MFFRVPLKPDEEIKQAEILLFYNVQLMENLVLKLEGLVRVTASSPLPGAQLHVIGDLYFQQSDALSLQGIRDVYANSVLENVTSAAETAIQTILANENKRNETISLQGSTVWIPGAGSDFTITATASIPNQPIRYVPSAMQTMKWAWLQYLGSFVVIAYPMWYFRSFLVLVFYFILMNYLLCSEKKYYR